MNRITKILNGLYFLIVILFLLDFFTGFDIKNQFLKSSIYFGFMFLIPIVLLWNLFFIKKIKVRIIGTIYPIVFFVLVIIIGFMPILFLSNVWQTQTILYQNGHLKFNKIEFQMQNIGALGYNKRTVEVLYLTQFFAITSEVPKDIEKRVEWFKVNKNINELEIKNP